jgi:hypothetical protein
MFWREPVVWDERASTGARGDVAYEVPERLRRTPVEPATVKVQNHVP